MKNTVSKQKNSKLSVKEIAVLGMLTAFMYVSKLLLDALPNFHLIATFIVSETVVFRKKALYSIYAFALIICLTSGFSTWSLSYFYIWTVLWGAVMILPKNLSQTKAIIIYPIVSALHGIFYGTLFAPLQALFFGLDFKGTLSWIIAGLPFDLIHGVSNFLCGLLILPIINVLRKVK